MTTRQAQIMAAVALWLFTPASACAHLVDARFGDFYAGFFHPLTAIEHAAPFLAAGLLAGQQGTRGARVTLALFVLGLLVGLLMGHASLTAAATIVNSVSFVVLGGAVAVARRLPLWVIATAALAFGLTHGYANASAMKAEMLAINFDAGVVSAGVVVISLGAGIVLSLRRSWSLVAVRVVGSWIAAIGLMNIALM